MFVCSFVCLFVCSPSCFVQFARLRHRGKVAVYDCWLVVVLSAVRFVVGYSMKTFAAVVVIFPHLYFLVLYPTKTPSSFMIYSQRAFYFTHSIDSPSFTAI